MQPIAAPIWIGGVFFGSSEGRRSYPNLQRV
jgi:hypothetical protein